MRLGLVLVALLIILVASSLAATIVGLPILIITGILFFKSPKKNLEEIRTKLDLSENQSMLLILSTPIIVCLVLSVLSGFMGASPRYVEPYILNIEVRNDSILAEETLTFHLVGDEMSTEIYRPYVPSEIVENMRILDVDCSGAKDINPVVYAPNKLNVTNTVPTVPINKKVIEVACRKSMGTLSKGVYTMRIKYVIQKPYTCLDSLCIAKWKVFENFPLKVKDITIALDDSVVDFYSYPSAKSIGGVMKIKEVNKNEMLEINLVVPRSIPNLQGIYLETGEPDSSIKAYKNQYWFPNIVREYNIWIPLTLVLIADLIILLIYAKIGKEKQFEVPDIIHYLPSGKKPYEVNLLFFGDPYKISDDAILATLLDLARRGYMEIHEGKIKFLKHDTKGLDEFEKKVFNTYLELLKLSGKKSILNFDKLREVIARTKDIKKVAEIAKMLDDLYEVPNVPYIFDTTGRILSYAIYFLVGIVGLVIGIIANSLTVVGLSIACSFAGIIAIAAFDSYALGKYKGEYAKEREIWNAFRRLINNYELVEKYGPKTPASWTKWLVYATAFGEEENVKRVMRDKGIKAVNIHHPEIDFLNPSIIKTVTFAKIMETPLE